MDNNMLDIELAKSVGPYFRLREKEMNNILDEVKSSVSGWQRIVTQIGIPRSEQTPMAAAFKVKFP
jgi:serine/threonine-protein kinase HipA